MIGWQQAAGSRGHRRDLPAATEDFWDPGPESQASLTRVRRASLAKMSRFGAERPLQRKRIRFNERHRRPPAPASNVDDSEASPVEAVHQRRLAAMFVAKLGDPSAELCLGVYVAKVD